MEVLLAIVVLALVVGPFVWLCAATKPRRRPPAALTAAMAMGMGRTPQADAYAARHGIASRTFLTITRPEHADWIIFMLGDRIAGKVVVEIGAGNGLLALAMARKAKHVYAIEAYPPWAARFATESALDKPANLTWILDRAENLEGLIRADIAVVVTGSDADHLRELAGRFAPDVAMPWQDWNDGKAVIRS